MVTNFLRNVKYGLQNLWKWKRIIYTDRDWDWAFLYTLIEFKLENMAKYHRTYGITYNAGTLAEEMEECARLLRRIRDEDYKWEKGGIVEMQREMEADEEVLWTLIKEKSRNWWD